MSKVHLQALRFSVAPTLAELYRKISLLGVFREILGDLGEKFQISEKLVSEDVRLILKN